MAANNRDEWNLSPGDVLDDQYTIIDQLRRGNYSMVYLGRLTDIAKPDTSQLVILKVAKPAPTSPFGVSNFEEKLARNEIASLRREHEGVGWDGSDEARTRLLMPVRAFEYGSLERPILVFTELCGSSVHEFA